MELKENFKITYNNTDTMNNKHKLINGLVDNYMTEKLKKKFTKITEKNEIRVKTSKFRKENLKNNSNEENSLSLKFDKKNDLFSNNLLEKSKTFVNPSYNLTKEDSNLNKILVS